MVEFKAKRQVPKQVLTLSAQNQGLDQADVGEISLELRPNVDNWLLDSALEHLREIAMTPLTFRLSSETKIEVVSRKSLKKKKGGKK